MKDFQRRSKLRSVLESGPALVLLAGVLLFSVWNMIGFWRKMSETEKNRQVAEDKVIELTENKLKLEADISKLESDRGVEEILRTDFGLSREGEGVIVIVDDQNRPLEESDQGGFWSWWGDLFE